MNNLKKRIVEEIILAQGYTLDAVEIEFGEKPQWPHIRSRILKAFGDRGLIGKIEKLFTNGQLNNDGGAK